jgi:hypothetical protein
MKDPALYSELTASFILTVLVLVTPYQNTKKQYCMEAIKTPSQY